MKTYTEFLNEKGNVRPAARALAKTDGLATIVTALENDGLDVSTDSLGSLVVKVGVTDTGLPIFIRLDAVVTTLIR
jgi:divalent metal cation (Fe/Co/Zn/Cd) transporter